MIITSVEIFVVFVSNSLIIIYLIQFLGRTTGRWSTGSLTDSGRGHSEEDDVTTGLYVRVVSDPPTPTTKTMLESHGMTLCYLIMAHHMSNHQFVQR